MITYWIWDRIRCIWVMKFSSLAVWRSIPRAVGVLVCSGVPLALLAVPPAVIPYTPTSGTLPASPPTDTPSPAIPSTRNTPGATYIPYIPFAGILPPVIVVPPPPPSVGPGAFPPGENTVSPPAPTVGQEMPSPFTWMIPPPEIKILEQPPAEVSPPSPMPPPEIPGMPVIQVAEPAGIFIIALMLFAITRRPRRCRYADMKTDL